MKRFREGYAWVDCAIGMTSRYDRNDGLVLIPFDQFTGQCLFRFMVEG